MKRYGIIKKIQLGDDGYDRMISPCKTKDHKRRDKKRARQNDKKIIKEENKNE